MNSELKTYIVISGRPAGEVNHRFVAIVRAPSGADALHLVEQTERYQAERASDLDDSRVWGPHAYLVYRDEDPMQQAEYYDTEIIDMRTSPATGGTDF